MIPDYRDFELRREPQPNDLRFWFLVFSYDLGEKVRKYVELKSYVYWPSNQQQGL
jgi:hypothetical protein